MTSVLPRPTQSSYVMLVSLILIWGTTFYFMKLAVAAVHPSAVVAARITLAAAVVVPFAVVTGRPMLSRKKQWLSCVCVSVFSLAVPLSLIAWAQQIIPSGIAGVYMAAIPLFVLPLAHIFSPGEYMTLAKLIGFVTGFAGVLMLIGPETLSQITSSDGLAQLALLGAAFSYACGSMIIRRAPKSDPIAFSATALVIASFMTVPFAILHWPTAPLSLNTLMIFTWIGVVATGLAMVLRVSVISTAGSVFMSLTGYFVPITALLVGALAGGEKIELMDAFACALILSGVAYAQFGGKRS